MTEHWQPLLGLAWFGFAFSLHVALLLGFLWSGCRQQVGPALASGHDQLEVGELIPGAGENPYPEFVCRGYTLKHCSSPRKFAFVQGCLILMTHAPLAAP